MQLSRAGDYGLRVTLALAGEEPGAVVPVRELSRQQGVPSAFLAKVVGQLTAAGILRTTRGASGGASLARDPSQITMLQVVEAIDGPISLNFCLACPTACRFTAGCVLREAWYLAQSQLRETLAATDLAELARRAAGRSARSGSSRPDQTRAGASSTKSISPA